MKTAIIGRLHPPLQASTISMKAHVGLFTSLLTGSSALKFRYETAPSQGELKSCDTAL
jgi:hypothetical protein